MENSHSAPHFRTEHITSGMSTHWSHSAPHFRTEHITSGMSTHWSHSAQHFRTAHITSGMLQDKENDSFNHKELSSSLSVKYNTYSNALKTEILVLHNTAQWKCQSIRMALFSLLQHTENNALKIMNWTLGVTQHNNSVNQPEVSLSVWQTN